ncbi:MAG: hypothetical protein Kow0080_06310 [Candidatus Promineifilaceae bacterium]
MTTQTATGQKTEVGVRPATSFFSGRRGRMLRNNITAYLFLAPAAILIFTFGIFPVFYAAYVSLYKWRIRQGEYRGLANFVNAMGDVAYLFFALVILALAVTGIIYLVRMYRTAQEYDIPIQFPLLSLIPGGIIAYGLLEILLRFITFFTQENAIEAGYAQVLGNIPLGLLYLVIGFALSTAVARWQHKETAHSKFAILPNFTTNSVAVVAALGTAVVLTRFTLGFLNESGTTAVTLIRLRALVTGLIPMVIAYGIWTWAARQESLRKMAAGIVAAALFIAAGAYIIDIWPVVTAEADPNFYLSFAVTVFYAAGAVPFQLGLALILAVLLYQDLKGKALFRVIFFIPYIAPTVAGAAIFQVLFSLRAESIANRIMQFFTGNPELALRWLKEPTTFISIMGQTFGIESAANINFGPSLALIVVILFSIWRYTGYDTVIFLAGLGGIPGELYEAAEIDGANRWDVFRHITFPLLSPTTYFLSVISILGTFKAFNSIWVLRDAAALGTVDTASIYFFETFQRGARFGYATSMAMVLFAVMLTLTIIQNRLAEKRVFYG